MELEHKTRILAGLCLAQVEAHKSSTNFGYWEKKRTMAEGAALLHLRVSKALEVATVGDGPSKQLEDMTRLEEAFADIIIATLDIGEGFGLHVAPAVIAKMDHNEKLSAICKKDF